MKPDLLDLYTDYLMTSTGRTTATGMSEMLEGALSHDAITRFLSSEEKNSKTLWQQVKPVVREVEREEGVVIFDDTIQDKSYSKENDMICYHWDHSKGRNIKGINLLNCLYHAGGINIPIGYEIVKKTEKFVDKKTGKEKRKSEKNKNEMFREMIDQTVKNQLKFKYILADIWFSSTENMEHIKKRHGKDFVMGVKANRLVALSGQDKKAQRYSRVEDLDMPTDTVQEVWMKGVSFPMLLFKKVFTNKDGSIGVMYLVCSDLTLTADQLYELYQKRWNVEEFHKSVKCNASLGKSPARTLKTQGNHIFASIFAYFKFEQMKMKTHLNHFALKSKIYMKALKTAFQELQSLKNDLQISD